MRRNDNVIAIDLEKMPEYIPGVAAAVSVCAKNGQRDDVSDS